jgi:hypothetical protein
MGLNHVPVKNIAVGACNRVSPIEPARVTCWPHLMHLKVYKERSPEKRRKSSGFLSPYEYRTAVIF